MSLVASAVNTAPTSGGAVQMIIRLLVVILILIALYYLYKYMYGATGSLTSIPLISSLTSATTSSSIDPKSVSVNNLTGISQGGQYSVTMWVYVASTKSNNSNLIHLLDITGGTSTAKGGNTLLFMGLDPLNATLVVRQSASGTNDPSLPVTGTPSSTSYTLSSLLSGYMSSSAGTPSSYTKDDRCDILNGVEFQRWVLVSVVSNGRTLDVYLDGKLSRSCVYNGNNSIGVSSGNAVITIGNRANVDAPMTGYFSTSDYYNYALTPDLIWGIYQRGPSTSSSNFFTSLFSTNINFGTTSGLNNK